jgi:dihydrofolate reductase
MESAWPAVARDPDAPPALRSWARKLEAKPKHVVSATRRDFPWANTFRVEGDLREAIAALKRRTPRGLLVGSPMLSAALEELGLIDEYRIAVHPVLAGHGPTLFSGLSPSRRLTLVGVKRLGSGVMALHYRKATRRAAGAGAARAPTEVPQRGGSSNDSAAKRPSSRTRASRGA